MVRYLGPHVKVIRKLGSLRAFTKKKIKRYFKLDTKKRKLSFNKKTSKYKIRLKEKQKLRFNFAISEKQLFNYVKKAIKLKGSSGENLLVALEMRLDNIVYRLGLAPTIISSRQLINHGHIYVDGKVVNIPSFKCKPTNNIKIKDNLVSKRIIEKNIELLDKYFRAPSHLYFNKKKLEAKVINMVKREDIKLIINELLIIEFYSRKV
uniref:Small ribosomal subunit protein uS4c n=1 Tax=Euglena longa TaxID=3037 RepID=RR4_EUGLO|nr:ribosomal protein S4 [Euglena longa]P58134.1 RecName: Full=Small ribosomal subunit protein uS4c; AltName: Full=Plastid 30S ribosomal protein S4 [Euglena longa]CAC24613.1 ribosomal protein S4 [Euglena longa]